MNLLFVGSGYPPHSLGGTEIHMQGLAQGLAARGHRLSVFCRGGDVAQPDYRVTREEVEGIEVVRVNYWYRDCTSFDRIYRNPDIDALFTAELDRIRPDLVHVHHLSGLSTSLLDLVKDKGIPLVMTLHDFWMVCPRGQRITADLHLCRDLDRTRCTGCLRQLWPHFDIDEAGLAAWDADILRRLRGCDLLIAPSRFHRERMLEVGLDAARLRVVVHGLDKGSFAAAREHARPPRRIGFIGTVIPSKGVHVLIEAFNQLGRPDLECHIHGQEPDFHGDTSYGEHLRARARPDLPVTFHGAFAPAQLPDILSRIDILVVPSLWWETFCLTIREAMLARIPVLASGLGAMHEALAPVRQEALFRPGDARDLADKLRAVLDDADLQTRLSRLHGQVRDLNAMVEETQGLYLEAAPRTGTVSAPATPPGHTATGDGPAPHATVFIPTYNGGDLFERVLDRVLAQQTDFAYEVLCIDSGSRDRTLDIIRARPSVRLIQIPNSEFNHGLTRNRGVREARGEIVALLTQDAEPFDEHWLQTLVRNFDDPRVAGAYCHQLPREDCNPFQRERLEGWTRGEGEPQPKRLENPAQWDHMHPYDRYLLIAFDDVASSVRKRVMQDIPYEKRQFGEDVAWGKQAILAGHTLVMDPRSVVIHSHNNPISYEFKRVYLDHQNLYRLVGLHTVPSLKLVFQFSLHATRQLAGTVRKDDRGRLYRLGWLLKTPWYAFTQNLAQYLGARSAQQADKPFWKWLDARLRKGV